MTEDERAHRAGQERDGESDEREQQRDGRVRRIGEEHAREVVRRRGAIGVEVVELDRRAHHRGGDDRAHRRLSRPSERMRALPRQRRGAAPRFRFRFDRGHESPSFCVAICKTLLFGRVRDVMCVALPHRQGWILGIRCCARRALAAAPCWVRTYSLACDRAHEVSI